MKEYMNPRDTHKCRLSKKTKEYCVVLRERESDRGRETAQTTGSRRKGNISRATGLKSRQPPSFLVSISCSLPNCLFLWPLHLFGGVDTQGHKPPSFGFFLQCLSVVSSSNTQTSWVSASLSWRRTLPKTRV